MRGEERLHGSHGQRVVNGHRLMQAASDIFLGWTEGRGGRHYYIRQLRDARSEFLVETFQTAEMTLFAQWCGYSAGALPCTLRGRRSDQRIPGQE